MIIRLQEQYSWPYNLKINKYEINGTVNQPSLNIYLGYNVILSSFIVNNHKKLY